FTLPLVGLLALFGTLLLRHRLRCGDLLGPRALCGLALARISERTHARVLLLFGELRQHHTSTVRLSFLLRSLGKERLRPAARGEGLGLGSSTGCGVGPAPSDRRFFFSTRTDFDRPWLKLWRTWPDSTVRRTLRVILRPRAALPSVSFVSLIRRSYPLHSGF